MKSLSILLAEDNEADVVLTSELLRQIGDDVSIDVVKDGFEAICYLKKEGNYINAKAPDLVLLDINMPKIDGREVLKFIKTTDQLSSIHVIMYTSSHLESDILYCHNNGCNLYLNKADSMAHYLKIINAMKDYVQTHFANKF